MEIEEGGLLMAAAGETRQLHARVYDSDGNPMSVPITWLATTSGSAINPHIAVDQTGLTTAMSNGVAQIVASAGGVSSAPLVGLVTPVGPGTILLTDAQIVGDPRQTILEGDPESDSFFDVTLTNTAVPDVGAILINMESKPVAGRVVTATPNGANIDVHVEILPFQDLFPDVEINEQIDLSKADMVFDDEITEAYTIKRVGDTFEFTLKPELEKAADTVTRKAKTWSCESDAGMTFGMPTALSMSLAPRLDVKYKLSGFERLVLSMDPTFKATLGLKIDAGFTTSLKCDKQLGSVKPRVAGWLSYLAGVRIPWGIGASIENSVTAMTLELTVGYSSSAHVELGIECPQGGECTTVRDFSRLNQQVTPTASIKGDSIRFSPSVKFYFYEDADLEAVEGFLGKIKALSSKMGVEILGTFGIWGAQLSDPNFAAEYGLNFFANLEFGEKFSEFVETKLKRNNFAPEIWRYELALGKSPSGIVTLSSPDMVPGQQVEFEVDIEGEYLFPVFRRFYNIDRVLLIRRDGLAGTIVASVGANEGQTHFRIPYTPDTSGSSNEYFVFVVTRFLPIEPLALKIGRAAANVLQIYKVSVACTAPTTFTDRGPGVTQVETFQDRICASGAGNTRYFQACRLNGEWMAKEEARDDIHYNTRNRYAGEYERDRFKLTKDGTFEMSYEVGWDDTTENDIYVFKNYYEYSVWTRINPHTNESGGAYYRKIDRSTESKRPNTLGTTNVTERGATVLYGPQSMAPEFRGWFSWDPHGPLPELIETRGIAEESEIPKECSGPTPHTSPY